MEHVYMMRKCTVRDSSAAILCLHSPQIKRAIGKLKYRMGRVEDKFSDCLLMGSLLNANVHCVNYSPSLAGGERSHSA